MLVTMVIMAQFQNLAAGVAAGDLARQTPRAMLNVSLTGGDPWSFKLAQYGEKAVMAAKPAYFTYAS